MRIAIFDDDPDHLAGVGAILTAAGHEATVFRNARDGLKTLDRDSFDAVVTDILMPELDGVEVIRAIREKHPGLWIVAMSGGGRVTPATTALKLSEAFGADRVLFKPFSKAELLAALERGPSAVPGTVAPHSRTPSR